jgi:hypothetical protein
LLTDENFKRSFRDKQTWAERRRILDGCLNILFTQIFKWIYAVHYFVEDLVENIIDSGTTLALNCNFFNELPFNLITIRVQEHVDQIQNHGSLVRIFDLLTLSQQREFPFFLLELLSNLLVQTWNALLDVINQNLVE